MSHFQKTLQLIKGMTLVNKTLIIFACLLVFILVVERPSTGSLSRSKGDLLLFPQLTVAEASKLEISNLAEPVKVLTLENQDGQWKVVNGHSFPADRERLGRFLSILENMTSGQVVSNNPNRMAIFGIDAATSPHIRVWGKRNRLVADFLVGKSDSENRPYLKRSDSADVTMAPPDFGSFLQQDLDGWKDKTLVAIDEKNAMRIVLEKAGEETILERKNAQWRLVSPQDSEADALTLRTLFEQLKSFKADRFSDSMESSQVDFDKPDMTLSIRLADDSLKVAVFKALADKSGYYAKDGDRNLTYFVSALPVDNLFGLNFAGEGKK
ncbi:DUF4340 domain-containing protein [Candidatus Peregrinibacteria bacterium]|nr:DUF4340 domain-containing protein [Candidatus Peregrinibacteria bacterium]